jgi:hypothetical protein
MEPHSELVERAERAAADAPLAADVGPAVAGGYRGYGELLAAWAALVRRGARPTRIGTTVAGEPLFAVAIGAAGAPVASVLLAGIHPIEWIGVETGLAVLDRLVADPPDDRQVIAVPLINVDGYRRVEADLRAGRRRFIRTNDNGVDLNRNWPVHFRAGSGLTSRLAGWNSGGPAPLSEPEIAAVVGYLDEVAGEQSIVRALSLHSIGRKILTPYGGRWRRPDDFDDHRAAAEVLRRELPDRYTITPSSHWVPGAFAHGMEIDTLHDRYGAVALLVECSWGGASPARPGSLIHPFRWFNPPDPARELTALAVAIDRFLRG